MKRSVESPPPVRDVEIKSLRPERVDQAFPLIQAIAPTVTLAEWRAFAAPLLPQPGQTAHPHGNSPHGTGPHGGNPHGGILVAEDERGYMAGLVAYRLQHDLTTGPVLVAEHFVAFDFFERDRIADALARALEGLAAGHRCAAIETVLPDGIERARRQWLVEMLELRGHQPHRFALRKAMSKSMAVPQAT